MVLPEIVQQQQPNYPLPPPLTRYERAGCGQRLARSEDPQMYNNQEEITYEYQVDDAAGIPSLGFFRKTYSMPT